MRKPEINNVEVDMVPLIDIISLLLMFLIIVGDTTASSNIAGIKLPAAGEAKTEKEWGIDTKNRIVIQLKPEYDTEEEMQKKNGKYFAVFNAAKHDGDDEGKSLEKHLQAFITERETKDHVVKNKEGTWDIPVKLRIPANCPMAEAEKVLFTIAKLQLVNIQYAAVKDDKKK